MVLLLKINLLILALGAVTAIVCLYLDRKLLSNHENTSGISQVLLEQVYLFFIKIFTIIYFVSLFVIAFTGVMFVISLISPMIFLPGDASFSILAVVSLLALGSIVSLAVALRKPAQDNSVYMSVTKTSEPQLYQLTEELADYFSIHAIDNIRITPGAEIQITEDVSTIDDVFYSGSRRLEIGLSALQFLTASDLKVLLARQFSFYEDGDKSPGMIINRLNKRLKLMVDNLLDAGFLMVFNPVFWYAYSGQLTISYVTRGYSLLKEIKADESAVSYSSPNRLKTALARYNVEIQQHREIIDAAGLQSDHNDKINENIYSVLKNSYKQPDDRVNDMVNYLFDDNNIEQEGISRSIKLRLKRLPESAEYDLGINRPAFDYLADWNRTEYRMMRMLNRETV